MKTPLLDRLLPSLKDSFTNADADVLDRMGGDYPRRCISSMEKALPLISEDPCRAAGAIESALRSRYPKAVYYVGKDTRYINWPLSCLPHFLRDLYMRWSMDMPGAV